MTLIRSWKRWILFFAGWTFVGLFFSTQIYFIVPLLQKKTISWWHAIRSTVPDWYVWALFAFFIFPLSRRLRFERVGWRIALPIHLAASLLFSVLHVVLAVSVLNAFETMSGHTISWVGKFRANFVIMFHCIHRSTIVNIDRIRSLHPLFHGDYKVLLHNGSKLQLSRRYVPKVKDRLWKSL